MEYPGPVSGPSIVYNNEYALIPGRAKTKSPISLEAVGRIAEHLIRSIECLQIDFRIPAIVPFGNTSECE